MSSPNDGRGTQSSDTSSDSEETRSCIAPPCEQIMFKQPSQRLIITIILLDAKLSKPQLQIILPFWHCKMPTQYYWRFFFQLSRLCAYYLAYPEEPTKKGQTITLAQTKFAQIHAQSDARLGRSSEPEDWNSLIACPLNAIAPWKLPWCTRRPAGWPPWSKNWSRKQTPALLPLTWKSILPIHCAFGHAYSWMKQAKALTTSKPPPQDGVLLLHLSPRHNSHPRHA